MNINLLNTILISILVLSYFITLAIGLFLGYIIRGQVQANIETPMGFLKNNKKQSKKNYSDISIDDTKVVLGLSTEGMEKKFMDITQDIVSKNDITQSVNKLKNMKGK